MESNDFINKYSYYDWTNIPNGTQAAVAKYRQFKQVEYNNNPMIETLPPILSQEQFIELVAQYPIHNYAERQLEAHERFHFIERLSRYFDPLSKTVDLQQTLSVLLMSGYISRNPLQPEYARRSRQIYNSIQAKDGQNLENYVTVSTALTTASGLTIIGESGLGKSTNLANILDLYPQVIIHPQHSVTQIVWLKVDCPHAGSLKGLCTDIFLSVDRLLGTNNFKKFGSKSNSEDYMLAQVAQIAHTHHLGLLVIDEMQNLANSRRGRDDFLNFLVKMDNIIGIPVIRVGTNEAEPILTGNFRNARRGTGEGAVRWKRMENEENWQFFVEGMWEYQWTKTEVIYSEEISDALYYETQGIIDILIKLYKMVQWRAISLGKDEIITVDLIHQVAQEGLYLVKPMLDAIRSGDLVEMKKYRDIAPVDISFYREKCLNEINFDDLSEMRRTRRNQNNKSAMSPLLKQVIVELLDLEIDPSQAKALGERVVSENPQETDIFKLVNQAYKIALQGEPFKESMLNKRKLNGKFNPNYTEYDMRKILEEAKKKQVSVYEPFVESGIIKDNPEKDFFLI
ncbi:Tn7-like transposition protein C [Gloeothece citriformis PCC 7424]|uniref:Tn7-like transposition protein C n=1 Tax=Gloeothece citriformis (strain PCC 7424) TaxID=65393 RepID=B7KHQ1_GLOC7|nr:ATP-binding protein [Gloeothece citriformis]ACK70746.1 Tn7-like transposition protein C [Gloeothece citriformis PCC 7424]